MLAGIRTVTLDFWKEVYGWKKTVRATVSLRAPNLNSCWKTAMLQCLKLMYDLYNENAAGVNAISSASPGHPP